MHILEIKTKWHFRKSEHRASVLGLQHRMVIRSASCSPLMLLLLLLWLDWICMKLLEHAHLDSLLCFQTFSNISICFGPIFLFFFLWPFYFEPNFVIICFFTGTWEWRQTAMCHLQSHSKYVLCLCLWDGSEHSAGELNLTLSAMSCCEKCRLWASRQTHFRSSDMRD